MVPRDDSLLVTGLVPVIPVTRARRHSNQDSRDKPGHDVAGGGHGLE
ncbi:hypothetical protein J4G37_12405 [Microvirga sp. 3-52]|nr:hypothetical protein [Microvirga sp. 3-52]